MARARTYRLTSNLSVLGRRIEDRGALRAHLRRLIAWQQSLGKIPVIKGAPDATPYVSLYVDGALRGCFGSHEGKPSERIARAFLLALTDSRWGGIRAHERKRVTAEIAYITRAEPMQTLDALETFEAGTHGVALVDGDHATIILPSVAREKGLDARAMLDQLARKAGRERIDGLVWLLDVDTVSSVEAKRRTAKAWLESLILPRGEIAFAMDASGALVRGGTMRLGRIAVAIEALGGPKHSRAWLKREIENFDDHPDIVLGTLALAARAGLDVPLLERARNATSPWHAAQAASVLGKDTPRPLWDLCVKDLAERPFAPYLAMAARLRGDDAILERTVGAIVHMIRDDAPFEGGLGATPIPETALTAVAIEAIAPSGLKKEVARARSFIARQQILEVPASMSPAILGAVRASPIAPIFRCDITAHALLALGVK